MLENMGLKVLAEGSPFEVPSAGRHGAVSGSTISALRRRMAPRSTSTRSARPSRRPSSASGRRGGERRLQPAGPRRRARLARGHRAARLLQVPAPDRHPVQPGLYGSRRSADIRRSPRCSSELFSAASIRPSATVGVADDVQATVDGLLAEIDHALDDVANLDEDRILRLFLNLDRGDAAHQLLPAAADGEPQALPVVQARLAVGRRAAAAAAAVRDLRLRPRVEGDPSARRQGGARRHPLVRPARGFPHRDPGPDEGADGQERGHRAGRLQGRLRGQAAARDGDREALQAEGVECYKTLHARPARHHRQPRADGAVVPPPAWSCGCDARRSLSRRRRRQGHRHLLRHRQRRSPRNTASGSATPSPRAARPATTTRRWASPRAAPGSRSSAISASSGIDIQTQDFTVVGVGDMSGDVFGNGMLLSQHIQAARRLRPPAHLPRSRSRSGGELRRAPAAVRPAALELGRLRPDADLARAAASSTASAKSITDQRRDAGARSASTRDAADAGRADPRDPAGAGRPALARRHRHLSSRPPTRATPRSATRPTTRCASTARELRAKVVGEGANLGFTQRGRIEYRARAADASTPTPSTTRPASTPPTTRSTSRSCSAT